MKIFYRTASYKRVGHDSGDSGIFFGHEPGFQGTQYNLKDHKYQRFYDYEQFIFQYYKRNKDYFRLMDKDISFMANAFLLLTFDFFGYNSIGNHLTLIDLLNDILKKNKKKKEAIEVYCENDPEIPSLIKKCFSKQGIEKYAIHLEGKKKKKLPLSVIRTVVRARLRWRHMAKFFTKKRDSSKKTAFLQPPAIQFDVHKSLKEYVPEYEVLRYELVDRIAIKEEFFNLFKEKRSPTMAQFYTARHFKNIKSIHDDFVRSHRKMPMTPLLYEGIDLTEETKEFFEVFFSIYALLIVDALLIADKVCETYTTVFFSYITDPLIQAIAINSNKTCRKFSVQSEMIFRGCCYSIVGSQTEKDFVWDEYSKELIVRDYGYDRKKVVVIGNIRFQDIPKKSHKRVTILFASQGFVQPTSLDFFIEVCKKVKNDKIRWLIKPHPVEDINKLREKIRDTSMEMVGSDIKECLAETDVMVTHSSGAAFDAIYNNIPIVIVNPNPTLPPGIAFYRYFKYFTDAEACAEFFDRIDWHAVKSMKIPKALDIQPFKEKEFKKIMKKK